MGILKTIKTEQWHSDDDRKGLWDPYAILNVINEDRGTLTCVGHAASKRRRCMNPLAASNRHMASTILDDIALKGPQSLSVERKLTKLAQLTLCVRYHQGQVGDMVYKWQRAIDLEFGDQEPLFPKNRHARRNEGIKVEPDIDPIVKMMEDKIKQTQEMLAKYKRMREKATRRDNERRAREEEEARRKAEKLRKDREAEERREQFRRAGKKGEEERQAWDQAWQLYTQGWIDFDAGNIDRIFYPVISGRRNDLTPASIESFFRTAPPAHIREDGAEMFKILQRENLRWHPDKILNLFENPGAEDKELVGMVATVVIRLRKEFQVKRGEQS